MGYHQIRLFLGDGIIGLPRFAPFDKIIVTAAAREVPEALKDQLKVGGCLVIPVGGGQTQSMLRICRLSEVRYNTEKFDQFRFVPLLSGIEKKSK
jgi:protein-L-isoaspartate(D-aspartate) O-methyltransferase